MKPTSKTKSKKASTSSKPENMKATSKATSKKVFTPSTPEDTITLNRSHFYMALVVLAFSAGILVGFVAWGRTPVAAQMTVSSQPTTQASVAQAPAQTQAPQYVRYEIPAEGFPSLGPEDAPIVMVEFSDFQCPFCKRFHDETSQALLAAYPDKIRFVYRHLPLTSIHPNAFPAAEAAMCANDQNSFWQYHDAIFSDQQNLGPEMYPQIATTLGLDMTTFQDCLTSEKYKDAVQKDLDFALKLGVNSTPTFFLNGLAVVGAQPLEAFTQLIDKELAGEIPK